MQKEHSTYSEYPHVDELIARRKNIEYCKTGIERAINILVGCYEHAGKVLICGNGGSCADSAHIAGELMKGFLKNRPMSNGQKSKFFDLGADTISEKLQMGLPAIDLCAMSALITAIANDMSADLIFAQQIIGLGHSGDVFWGISTSGNAENVHNAAITAKTVGMELIGFTGGSGGKMRESGIYDALICVPETVTHLIQEEHIALYHSICLEVEQHFFKI